MKTKTALCLIEGGALVLLVYFAWKLRREKAARERG